MAFESWIPGTYIRQGTPTFASMEPVSVHNMIIIASGRFVV